MVMDVVAECFLEERHEMSRLDHTGVLLNQFHIDQVGVIEQVFVTVDVIAAPFVLDNEASCPLLDGATP